MKAEIKYTAVIIESERGWGSKVDEIKEFDTHEERDKFIGEFNAQNTKSSAPDWYMYARAGQDKITLDRSSV